MDHELIFLVVGLFGLAVGSDFLIRSSKNLAEHFGIPDFLVGLAFVSIGTSIPEIAVSVAGGLDRLGGLQTSGVAFGNAIGSALNQTSVIFGTLAFLVPLQLTQRDIRRQGSFLIASVLFVFALSVDGVISRMDGIAAVVVYLLYYASLWFTHRTTQPGPRPQINMVQQMTYALLGLALVLFTSDIVVESAVHIAEMVGVRQSLIGIFLVGLGTGLPEFSVAIMAFRRDAMGVSMGNLLGSNICDLLFSLGLGAIISDISVDSVNVWFDLPVLLILCIMLLYFLFTGRRVSNREGMLLIIFFGIYALLKLFVTG